MTDLLESVHPGDILREEYMIQLNLSAYMLAKDINVPSSQIQDIISRRRSISPDTALRLGLYFGTSSQFWLGIQAQYDTEQLLRAGNDYAAIKPRVAA